MSQLGTLEDLPKDYVDAMAAINIVPLWPSIRGVLPHNKPIHKTQPVMWRYADVRPHLLRAGELTPIEKAERRVLVLCNPGYDNDGLHSTGTIYLGLQLILPGETAPNHRHTPTAIRLVVEGEGGYTIVNGERLPMQRGDLIITPALNWHQHEHNGKGPVVWLDALDVPVIYAMEASYALEGPTQIPRNAPDASATKYRRAGLVPYSALSQGRGEYPLLRWPWAEVREALNALATDTDLGKPIHLGYVNPDTGMECLPTLGFSAIMLRPGEETTLVRDSSSAAFHIIEGSIQANIDGTTYNAEDADTLAAPTHARVTLSNRSTSKPAYLFRVDDAPLQRKLRMYEVFA